MFSELFERLTKRKTEVARQKATVWQQLVIDIADGKEIDPDAVLSDLDRLGKSPDELSQAVELLNQRRAWAATVAAGVTAETEHPKAKRLVEDKAAEFTAFVEKYQVEIQPLEQSVSAALFSMTTAADARRELVRTATDPAALAAVRDVDAQLADLRRERAEFDQELIGKQSRLKSLAAQQDPDLDGHTSRLTREIDDMQDQELAFRARAEQLNAESEAASARLLSPEAI